MKIYILFILIIFKSTFIFSQESDTKKGSIVNQKSELKISIDTIRYQIITLERKLSVEKKDKNIIPLLKSISAKKDSLIGILSDSISKGFKGTLAHELHHALRNKTINSFYIFI